MGFWSNLFGRITRTNERPLPPRPNPGGGIFTPPQPPPQREEQEEVWGGAGANSQEIDTLVALHERFLERPTLANWKAYAEAQEQMGFEPDWAEFRANHISDLTLL